VGLTWVYAPLLEVALEPLWSRNSETLGEDPHLVGSMAAAWITGLQQTNSDATGIQQRVAALGRNFTGYSKPLAGKEGVSWIPRRHLMQYYMPPWKHAIQAGLLGVMLSGTEYDGVPVVVERASSEYLLRQRLGFNGVVLTDFGGVNSLYNRHHVVANTTGAAVLALQKGSMDMCVIMNDYESWADTVLIAVNQSMVNVSRITESAYRVLRLKEKLGICYER
jgi:beta-glucosidase